MSKNRIKLPPTIITRARAEEILGEIASLTIEERDTKNALDRAITEARETHQPVLTALAKQIEEKTALLESWAAANPAEFGKKKSIDLLHGTIGYRTGNPRLKTLARWTWDRVLEAIRLQGRLGFIRTKEEVNKEAIITAVNGPVITAEDARTFGVQVVQEESFFVEPKIEALPTRTVKEVAA